MSETENTTTNPLMAAQELPRFDEVQPQHVMSAVEAAVAKIQQDLADLEAGHEPTWIGLVVPYMRLGDELEYAWSPVSHLLSVRNTDEMRTAYEEAQPLIVELSLKIGQSKPIYEGLKTIEQSVAYAGFDDAQKRTVEKYIRSAERSGVGLVGEEKDRFLEIQRELSELSVKFNNNVLDATKAYGLDVTDSTDAEGWPPTLKAIASQAYGQAHEASESTPEAGPWRITLDFPCFGPFMQHSRNSSQREAVFRAFSRRAADEPFDNSELCERMLELEKESANLLGYKTYAAYSLDAKMAGTPARVYAMYEQLESAARPASTKEVQALQAFAQEHGQAQGHEGDLKPWDVAFWSERQREVLFEFTDEQLRPYFPMPRVLDGFFTLCSKLFGITFECVGDEPSVWHADVDYYKVFNEAGQEIAGFYLDPYARPADKRGGAWMNDCLGRRVEPDGSVRLPVAHLICNGTPSAAERPSLMSFREVETLFHEFGHGLQHMLTTQPYASVAGINNVEWDAVELASQFMENWCYHKPILKGMTKHVETGESIPDDLFEKLKKAKTFMAGYGMMRQITLGQTDMRLYDAYIPGTDGAHALATQVAKQYMPLPPLEDARTLCSFAHIFAGGYSAGYFSYLWAEVLSSDAFAAFEEVGLDNDAGVEALGRKYRDTVLALGGGQHPMDVYQTFRGREPDANALLQHQGLLKDS